MTYKYKCSDLQDEQKRKQIEEELANKTLKMQVVKNCDGHYMLFKHSEFEENIFAYGGLFKKNKSQVGDIWTVNVGILHQSAQSKYIFYITNGVLTQKALLKHQKEKETATLDCSKLLNKMLMAKDKESFEQIVPQDWHISFEWVHLKENETFKKVTCLYQALADKGIASSKKSTKLAEFREILKSHPELAWLQKKLTAATPTPVTQQTNKPSRPPRAIKTTSGKEPRPDSAVHSPKNPTPQGIITGKDYNPSINPSSEYLVVSPVSSFSTDASHIRIYIDETWPGDQNPEYNNIGVISGIVWLGDKIDTKILPHIKTHLRIGNADQLQQALINIQKCPQALPFIFPILKDNVSQSDYPELLNISIMTLLGWILPQNGITCDVKIYCEDIASSAWTKNINVADKVSEQLNTLRITQNRCGRWKLSDFACRDKDFEYIPYADALAYTVVPTEKSKKLCGNIIKPETLPGYIPLSLDTLRNLCALDTDSAAGYADSIMNFAQTCLNTKIFAYMMQQTVAKAEKNTEFRDKLLDKLEDMFEHKNRNLKLLNTVSEMLIKKFPISDFDQYPQQKLIRILVELQTANHSGDPERVQQCVKMYQDSRQNLIRHNLELCVYADMNLAVHFNDRFDFSQGASICRRWQEEPAFNFLSLENQGRILSSIGQSYAFERNFLEAEKYFSDAVNIFMDPSNPLPHQVDHTNVYRALNILDAGYEDIAIKMAERVFGCSFAEAIDKYAASDCNPFHQHLLVKNLYFNTVVQQFIPQYLQYEKRWKINVQHPWELIELYRLLLLHKTKHPSFEERFVILQDLYDKMSCGATLNLLRQFSQAVYAVICQQEIELNQLEKSLTEIVCALPKTESFCSKIKAAVINNNAAGIWNILPFNYQ